MGRSAVRRGGLAASMIMSSMLAGCVSAAIDVPESENPASVHAASAPLPEVARALREDPAPLPPPRPHMHHHGATQSDAGPSTQERATPGATHEGHAMPGSHEGHATPDSHEGHAMPDSHEGHAMPDSHEGHAMPDSEVR